MKLKIAMDLALKSHYAIQSDHHREMAAGHREEAEKHAFFTALQMRNTNLAELHERLSVEYALLSGVHQEIAHEQLRQ